MGISGEFFYYQELLEDKKQKGASVSGDLTDNRIESHQPLAPSLNESIAQEKSEQKTTNDGWACVSP